MKFTTYYVRVNSLRRDLDAEAAADYINKKMGDAGISSFTPGDEAAELQASREISAEIGSCVEGIREKLYVEAVTQELDE